MRLDLRPGALRDLDAIRDHIARDNPTAASLMRSKLIAACDGLQDFPLAGRRGRGRTRELVTVRPYVIIYAVDPDVVAVLPIVHGARLR